jgi:hypothetical protein
MKNINIFSTNMFPYLEGEEVKGGELTLTIQDMKTEELKSHKGQKEAKEVLYFAETRKGFVLNKTNAKRIALMYGSMTGQWKGKQIVLSTESVHAFGQTHNALRVVPGVVVGQKSNEMSLEVVYEMLVKVERIKSFYTVPADILQCRPKSAPLPAPDDLDGWRNLYQDARDYALEQIEQAIEEDTNEAEAIGSNDIPDHLAEEYPEIFSEETE